MLSRYNVWMAVNNAASTSTTTIEKKITVRPVRSIRPASQASYASELRRAPFRRCPFRDPFRQGAARRAESKCRVHLRWRGQTDVPGLWRERGRSPDRHLPHLTAERKARPLDSSCGEIVCSVPEILYRR